MQIKSDGKTGPAAFTSATRRRICLIFAFLVATVFLQRCTTPVNLVQGVELPAGQDLMLGVPVYVRMSGLGTCKVLRVDWGDGFSEDLRNVDFAPHPTATHVYLGWAGGKTVTAIGVEGCGGRAFTRFKVEPQVYTVVFVAGPRACYPPPPVIPSTMVARSLVHVTTLPLLAPPESLGIDFGCYGGCRFNADGKPGSVAPANYPFPGLREYSLVFKVDEVGYQAGTNASFTTTNSGPLEICLNDNAPSDNRGAYEIHIVLNQLGPPPP